MKDLIDKIKEIDVMLDAYEYKNCTFEEYQECIKTNTRGNGSLRNMIRSSMHVWNPVMEKYFKELKDVVNMIYLVKKNKHKLNRDDIDKISDIINKIKDIKMIFKKNTDDCSIYPIQSECICNNLNFISKYLQKYMNMKYEEN